MIAALLITFREGLEAALIVGIVLIGVGKTQAVVAPVGDTVTVTYRVRIDYGRPA